MVEAKTTSTPVRLHKYLAACGLASRRHAERLIVAGRVAVDGRVVTTLGTKVDPSRNRITVDGQPLPPPSSRCLVIALHKPAGVITTARDPQGRTTVFDLIRHLAASRGPRRVFHVGRLDYESEGLLLLTNDGELAQRLAHPARRIPRTYRVKVRGAVSSATRRQLVHGVVLEDGPVKVEQVTLLKVNRQSTWLQVLLREGRNRLVRRLFQHLGHPVLRLIRVAYAGVELRGLAPGQARLLVDEEIIALRRLTERQGGSA